MAEPTVPPTDQRDWPKQATDTVVRYVDLVRDKTTTKALTAARVAVYGLVAAILAFVAFVLFLIGFFRFVDGKLPGGTWSAHLLFGAVFFLAGALLFSTRRAPAAHADR